MDQDASTLVASLFVGGEERSPQGEHLVPSRKPDACVDLSSAASKPRSRSRSKVRILIYSSAISTLGSLETIIASLAVFGIDPEIDVARRRNQALQSIKRNQDITHFFYPLESRDIYERDLSEFIGSIEMNNPGCDSIALLSPDLDTTDVRQRVLRMGFHDIVRQPFTKHGCVTYIRRWLGRSDGGGSFPTRQPNPALDSEPHFSAAPTSPTSEGIRVVDKARPSHDSNMAPPVSCAGSSSVCSRCDSTADLGASTPAEQMSFRSVHVGDRGLHQLLGVTPKKRLDTCRLIMQCTQNDMSVRFADDIFRVTFGCNIEGLVLSELFGPATRQSAVTGFENAARHHQAFAGYVALYPRQCSRGDGASESRSPSAWFASVKPLRAYGVSCAGLDPAPGHHRLALVTLTHAANLGGYIESKSCPKSQDQLQGSESMEEAGRRKRKGPLSPVRHDSTTSTARVSDGSRVHQPSSHEVDIDAHLGACSEVISNFLAARSGSSVAARDKI